MKAKKTTTTTDKVGHLSSKPLFEKDNITWMLIGAAVMIVGFILMSGGRSEDPNVFDKERVYSTTRLTIAPILILTGLVIEVYAIFRNPRAKDL
jgi:hypothetical protein